MWDGSGGSETPVLHPRGVAFLSVWVAERRHAYRLTSIQRSCLSGRTSAYRARRTVWRHVPPRGRQGSGNELKVILRSARETYNHRWRGKDKQNLGGLGWFHEGLFAWHTGVDRSISQGLLARTPCHGLGLKGSRTSTLRPGCPITHEMYFRLWQV